MILEDKHIDSTVACGLYGCTDTGQKLLVNCYDDMDFDKGLRYSKSIDYLSNKAKVGITHNPLTFERLSPFPMGIHRCNEDRSVLYITTNEWDLLTIAQVRPLEYNVIALIDNLDEYVSISNAFDFIHEFNRVVLINTSDTQRWLYEANKRICNDNVEVKTISLSYLRDCRSVNEFLVKYGEEATSDMLAALMTDLEDVSIPGVTDISSVKSEDKTKIRKYFTQIDMIDGKTGGLESGGLWLITGHTGNGKSEFAMQLSLSVVQQDGKVFYYAGEETKERFLSKLELKLADQKDIIKTPRKLYGGRYSAFDFDYSVTYETDHQIKKWLKNKYFIFDGQFKKNNLVDSVIEMLEGMHKEKGVTVFFLDNLMTLTCEIETQKLNSIQTELTNALVQFCKNYNVTVVLVAHPNKSSELDIQNKDVSGSFNVVNLASVVITVRRATAEEMQKAEAGGQHIYNSYISCTKDRPTGDTFRIGADFDTVNKIFIAGARPQYTWKPEQVEKIKQLIRQEKFPF
ncbi:AAA family ATPase [Cellulosilyticum lentocellum]|uniref:DnaB domain protein helicase domain protein n=1 Tax=Cellulosilyticum lentocellum (strain ATCC 49066 / DSM 5427 / NCIMB 11756 / RHM5) TaxID=642492 RepID=F2JQT4_CELLD|nr:AAA family ATPase [Cellulosilyticum lentocellum]ADZ82679.1 DnaB domain protein helicase domain protein [Cellulosilyticum lentocellum DSM 5427]